MHTPSPAFADDDDTPAEAASKVVTAVLAAYGRQLLEARRAGDQRRLAELTARLQECTEDRDRLKDAEPEEVKRIAALYAERWKSLDSAGS